MSYFYPQALLTLRVRWEDFDQTTNKVLSKISQFTIFAKDVSVNINDYTQADTFSAEVDYKSFPFDPRCIRALGVTVHIQDMKTLYKADGSLNILEPTTENSVFIGFADSEKIKLNDTDRIVTFEGRDFTSLLIDSRYDGTTLDLGAPLDILIQSILNRLPAVSEGKLKLDVRVTGALPTLGKFAPDFNRFANTRSGKRNESYWDVIQDIAGRAGLIAYIELDKLVLTKPRVLYGNTQACQFVYGKNIEDLSLDRKLGRAKGLNIVVRSVAVETKETLSVKIPEEASIEWCNSLGVRREPQKIKKFSPDGKETEETAPYLSFPIPNIKNTEQLREVGQGIWEELGRQQIEGSLNSKEMAVAVRFEQNSDPVEFDLTKFRNGTPIQIEIDQGDLEGFNRQKSTEQRVKFLIERGYEQSVAQALAVSTGKFKTRFYTKSLELKMANDGFSFSLDFINFIELGDRGLA
jgi:hypothetical protein